MSVLIKKNKMDNNNLPPETIEVGVYWYEDEDGKIVFDVEEMQREFEWKLKKITKNFSNDD